MWSAVVIGTHPVEENQRVWLEVTADTLQLGRLPAYWIENKAGNSLWHAPIPPQGVGVRLSYRSIVKRADGATSCSAHQETRVRPNLPDRSNTSDFLLPGAEALVGNRLMTARVDGRGSTYDLYFPTVGLHSSVRPKEGDLLHSRCHFRAIIGGLAVGRRLDWFTERAAWDVYQQYQGVTNLLSTKLTWRHGPVQVFITDFVPMGECLPQNAGREKSPGQYIKRYFVKNEGASPRRAIFAVYIQAEVNGGVGDTGLSWHDLDRCLLAINRGHPHSIRKLARDATIEFALALDERGSVECEPTGPNEAILFRKFELPAGGAVTIDMLISGAFTGWSGDRGTFEHWLRPALGWFRSVDLDQVEHTTAKEWDDFIEPLPDLYFPAPNYVVNVRRSALAAALHADAEWGAIASGFDRGLSAYCWPREAIWVGAALDRLGHTEIGREVYNWLNRVRHTDRPFLYWFQKYSIDGVPEWETPAVDQTALILWGLERHYRRSGDRDLVAAVWPIVEQAAAVCCGESGGHPGLRWLDDLNLISSAGGADQHFGAFLYSNACVVAGLRAAVRLAVELGRSEPVERWTAAAERIWTKGILQEVERTGPDAPGLVDPESGRFLQARRLSQLDGIWTDDPELLIDRSRALDIQMLGLAVPLGLLPAADSRLVRTAEHILRANDALKGDPHLLARATFDSSERGSNSQAGSQHEVSSLASLWMVRYLIQLGRETGQPRHWSRAIAMVEAIAARLSQLGLVLLPPRRGPEPPRLPTASGGMAWRLHAMLIDTTLDLAGVDYDAVARRLLLRPALAVLWPQMGMKQSFSCGEISYRLERPLGGKVHHLRVTARLAHPVELNIDLTCPDLGNPGPWQASPPSPEPAFDARSGRLRWTISLPAGHSDWDWTWG
jgi:glucoamylase